MSFNYSVIPSGAYSGTPPLETAVGGYYYKYSYSWTSKAASTVVDLCDTTLKFDSSKKNNGYIFLSCIGTKSSPPEFGIYAPQGYGGKWICYTREAGSTSIVPHETIFTPSTSNNGVYTYENTTKITMRIRLSGSNIIGTILRNGTVICSYSVAGSSAAIGSSTNTFLLGTSFVPNPETTSPGGRSAYLKHVYLRDGKLYNESDYSSTSTQWVPDSGNSVTYYALLCNTDYITYNRFGSTDEEVSIDYT